MFSGAPFAIADGALSFSTATFDDAVTARAASSVLEQIDADATLRPLSAPDFVIHAAGLAGVMLPA